MQKLITEYLEIENAHQLGVFESNRGYERIQKVMKELEPQQVVEEVKKSNLRGLGGAGFSTGMKWSFIPKDSGKPVYLVCNCDEAEPGTFKDRNIVTDAPHLLLEGMMIAAYAVGAHKAYIYIRGEYERPYERLFHAVEEAYQKGYLGKNIFGTGYELDIVVHRGAGAYICGEESALLESLEGKKGWPRLKPPFPAVVGLFSSPTVINNVETLSYLPLIMEKGAGWFSDLAGVEKAGGTRLFCVSGHVNKPGIYELPVDINLLSLINDYAGGVRDGKKLKAVVPGGISAPVLTAEESDVKMDFDSLRVAGTMAGSGGVMVMDEDTNLVEALMVACRFFAHESCGQCSPCREGSGWLYKIIKRIHEGGGRIQDLDNMLSIAGNISGTTICALGDACAMPVTSYINKFRSEFEDYINKNSTVGSEPTVVR